ncbi:MAG TPA: hypothetical protein VK815_00465 [Candidatus Acidoferrales bacterium]|nr:hypothetical protein [Candidatus Acidoferrales bacterium]
MSTNLADGSFNPPPPGGTGTDVVDVRGAFNGWGPLVLVEQGSSSVWTNSYDASNPTGTTIDYKFYLNGNGETTACYDNRTLMLPAVDGSTVVVPTHYYNDIGPGTAFNVKFQIDMSEELELGHFHPLSGDTVVLAGSFNGWSTTAGSQWVLTNDPAILVTNNNFSPAVVEHNVYTVTTPITQCSSKPGLPALNASQDFKYVEMPGGSWENSASFDSNDNGNRWFAGTGDQTLPLISFGDAPYTPLATVTLHVDLSAMAQYDANYVPNSVTAWGSFNGWSGPLTMTNDITAPNTNIYSATTTMGEGADFVLQYRYTNTFIGGWVYDYAQDGGPNWINNNSYRRIIHLPVTPTVLATNFPVVSFNDLALNDVLPVATPVLFSVDMNNAVGTDSHPFVLGGGDGVYINGIFAGASPSQPTGGISQRWYDWVGGINISSAPGGFQMIQQGSSTIYTNTIVLPAGTPVALSYQYGMDAGNFYGGPTEDEASSGNVHYRVVRSTGSGTYVMPTDTFTNQPYVEPFFSTGNIGANGSLSGGNLTVGPAVAGNVPVTWLGRPGAHLQVNSALSGGGWQDLVATDGTNWTTGSSSANGFASQTNWPAGSKAFFRLVKP